MRSLSVLSRCGAAVVSLVVGMAVLSVHSVASAQPGYYYPPPRPYARPYYPPRVYPGYPPPSSRYYYPPAPPPYLAPRSFLYRPISFGLGLGVGGLSIHDAYGRLGEAGLSYTARLGFGITRHLQLFVGVDGTGVDRMSHGTSQTGYLVGLQLFPIDRLYLRLGVGAAVASFEDLPSLRAHRVAEAMMGAVGFEILQGPSSALALEASATAAHYPDETWTNYGLNLVVTFY